MSKNIQEIHSGWLTKSPPAKRIWRGRWRRRWFVLHAGELPAQYKLSYFTDRNNHKLKGIIDLDQVEILSKGLKFEDKKLKFDYIFDIKTPTRTYYLAAETENEMIQWVNNICKLCNMRATSDEEDCGIDQQEKLVAHSLDSPPVSPVSTSPYIPISECITGKTPILPNQSIDEYNMSAQHVQSIYTIGNHSYEMSSPTYLNCASISINNHKREVEYCNSMPITNASPLQSPTDSESVFTDDDWSHNISQSDTSFRSVRPSNSSAEVDTNKKLNHVGPPRPPKPHHINTSQTNQLKGTKSGNHSKSNSTCDENTPNLLTDETYDFPRSHVENTDTLGKRHCYNNAAPSYIDGHIFTYDNPSPKPSTSQSQIFKYGDELGDEPASPLSQSSSTAHYSNLPSPLLPFDAQLMPPPKVNRGLKPKRKLSDSLSVASSTEPNSPRLAPSVDRKLKPSTTLTLPTGRTFESSDENFNRKCRAAPSPTPFGRSIENLQSDDNEQVYHYFGSLNLQRKKLEYLDLDLDNKNSNNFKQRTKSTNEDSSDRSPGAITVYKKVDFFKTEAFNITRNNLEKERKQVPQDNASKK